MSRPRNAIVYNADFATQASPVTFSLPECVHLLRLRHESVLATQDEGAYSAQLADNLLSLRLAESFLEKCRLNQKLPGHPLQIAVIGPTQSGKSSLVNLLLGEIRARVSPLAGYTVHPQGFPLNAEVSGLGWLDGYFQGYRRCKPDELPEGRYDRFALDEAVCDPAHPLSSSVIWDTPDFDSVDAEDYRNAVLATAALADVLLLVVSKDKYADQTVWDTMHLLEPLGQPTVVCLNKLSTGSAETLSRSLREKWRSARTDEPGPIASLPWFEDAGDALPQDFSGELLQLLKTALGKVDRKQAESETRRLLSEHWEYWLAPIRRELAARDEWAGIVESGLAEALSIYRRDYLDHPYAYETFQKALAELLTLLEIPGLAGGMAAARKIITWPVRQLTRLGKNLSGRQKLDQEILVLNRTIEHLFIHLSQALLEKGEEGTLSGYWRELGLRLREERKNGEIQRASAFARHVRDFHPEIERIAHNLHDKLREQPAVLNALRATRVTTDAAALGLALHTGGIGVQDFIIAPAILTVTSLLAESALGHYLHKAEAELKERQYGEARRLFDESLRPVLLSLPDKLKQQGRFNIPPAMIAEAEAWLEGAET